MKLEDVLAKYMLGKVIMEYFLLYFTLSAANLTS